ncbi:MAG: SMC-Scp complex subunit ScpB [bacterium]|jgi:segregation and condensation protein B|nr:SMC-Scp complex subunit ScpB [candidate division KSB1 bacterium]MDH7558749.1 SMC-Scp complex subunit ScpB [bacterium]
MEFETAKEIIEALIFASDAPVTLQRIRAALEEIDADLLEQAVEQLNDEYREHGHAFEIRRVAGGFQMFTRPHLAQWVRKYHRGRARHRLSRAALEALAIIAFKQPISRAEVAAVRGVNSDGVFKNLLERNLITMAGRASTVGRPVLYKTTEHFLAYFGINSLADLPSLEEVEALLKARAPREEPEPTAEETGVEVVAPGERVEDEGQSADGETQ